MTIVGVLAWAQRWWKAIVGGLAGAVVIGVGAFIAVGSYRRKAASAKAALEVERARRRVVHLQGQREEILRSVDRRQGEIARLEVELVQNKETIERVRREADVSPTELARELAELGF